MAYKTHYRDWTPRFWANVDKDGPIPAMVPELGPCWLWTAGKDGAGYGLLRVTRFTPDAPANRSGVYRAHQLAYYLEHGELPAADFHIRHLCENEACVRGSHLAKGTPASNHDDRVFGTKTLRTMVSRQEWNEGSLYDSNSRVVLYMRDVKTKKYQRLDSRPAEITGTLHLRYTNAEGKRIYSPKIPTWDEVLVRAAEVQQSL